VAPQAAFALSLSDSECQVWGGQPGAWQPGRSSPICWCCRRSAADHPAMVPVPPSTSGGPFRQAQPPRPAGHHRSAAPRLPFSWPRFAVGSLDIPICASPEGETACPVFMRRALIGGYDALAREQIARENWSPPAANDEFSSLHSPLWRARPDDGAIPSPFTTPAARASGDRRDPLGGHANRGPVAVLALDFEPL